MPTTQPADEFDGPWKEALRDFFQEFLELLFPEVHDGIDWSVPPEPKDKDFEKISAAAAAGKLAADKLIQVRLRSGATPWILIHIEAQGSPQSDFPKRMFRYGAAIYGQYDKEVVGIAILADQSDTWRPTSFGFQNFGAGLRYDFLTAKLIDLDEAELETSPNLFAPIILAHLKTQQTKGDPESRLRWKSRIVRGLYDRNLSIAQVRRLFRVIDWLLALPENQETEFLDDLKRFVGGRNMPYVSSVERVGIAKGRAIGKAEGKTEGKAESIQFILENRFGKLNARLRRKLFSTTDDLVLTNLLASALTAKSLGDFEAAFKQATA
jgi:hypothetical protein